MPPSLKVAAPNCVIILVSNLATGKRDEIAGQSYKMFLSTLQSFIRLATNLIPFPVARLETRIIT
jgi:hypothetical protein